jgi:methionyl-tRNA formyltransferase
MKQMNVVFMGTPAFVVPVLNVVNQICKEEKWKLTCVYTAPDKPKGRGQVLTASPVKERAQELGIEVLSPPKLTEAGTIAQFRRLEPTVVILAAFGLLLPPPFLFDPPFGAINIHPSLLPKYRGAAPVAGAILEGAMETGTSIIRMDEGLDTGPLLSQRKVALQGNETSEKLTRQLFSLGAEMLKELLPKLIREGVMEEPQNEKGASFYGRWSKKDGTINWQESAEIIERKVRAFDQWPGASTQWKGLKLEILEAQVSTQILSLKVGEVRLSNTEILVGTGAGSLALKVVKPEGKQGMSIKDFILSRKEFVNSTLPS